MNLPGSRSTLAPTLALLFVVAIWGATFTVVKEALQDASTLLFLALRFLLASLVLTLFLAPRLASLRPLKTSLKGGLLAGLALFSGYFFQTAGLRYTSAPNSAFITSLSVVAVPLLAAIVYRYVPRAAEMAGVGLATTGLALLTLQGRGLTLGLGDMLTLICALSFGVHVLLLARFAPQCSFEVLSLTQVCVTAAIAVALCGWAETPHLRWTPRLIFALCVTGILATAVAFTVQTWAQRRLSPLRTALLLALEPVFAWITSFLVAGESLSTRGSIGALLILAGALAAEVKPGGGKTHPSI